MTLLYSLHLSRHVKGFGKPSVHAVPAMICGTWRDGNVYKPDPAAIRAALPAYYRKAFDRANGAIWFDDNGHGTIGLRGSRGQSLNMLYATPYDFNPKGPQA